MNKKIAIVTGGARGLGLAISQSLKKEDFTVIILDMNKDAFAELTDFECYQTDVTDYQAVINSVEEICKIHLKIDLLVNNAGLIHSEPLCNLMNLSSPKHSYENFKKVLDVNLTSVFNVTSVVVEKMIKTRTKGTIVNISSISANGNVGQTAYSAAKAGVNSLTKVWAKELGSMGINVVAIAPGFIDTESTRNALSEKTIEEYIKKIPVRKLGKADDIANAVLFASKNKYISGTIIEIDGGMSL
jgi:3-oxoacyl-[acyl-carrier protein] reductase